MCTTKSRMQRKNNCRLTLQLSEPIVHDVMGRRNVSSRATSTPHFQQSTSEKRALLHMRGYSTNGGTKQPRRWLALGTSRAFAIASLQEVRCLGRPTSANLARKDDQPRSPCTQIQGESFPFVCVVT